MFKSNWPQLKWSECNDVMADVFRTSSRTVLKAIGALSTPNRSTKQG